MILVGANTGQELQQFALMGIKKVIAFEPGREAFEALTKACSELCSRDANLDYRAVNLALGEAAGGGTLNLANNGGASSSLLDPTEYLSEFPSVDFDRREAVKIETLDREFIRLGLHAADYNTLIMDTQGYELKVLAGARETLERIDFVISEVLYKELYKEGQRASELRDALEKAGFVRVWERSQGAFGDAAFVNARLLQNYPSLRSWTLGDTSSFFMMAHWSVRRRLVRLLSKNFLTAPLLGTFRWYRRPELRSGFSGPFNGQKIRIQTFRELYRCLGFHVILETGTYRGTTTEFFSNETGCPVYSCELEAEYYWYARARLRAFPNIRLYKMDSRRFLSSLTVYGSDEATPFCYLDAHWNSDLPLWDEIKIIWKRWPKAVIMIDDFAVPDDSGYGYDTYGQGDTLNLSVLLTQVSCSFEAFFPGSNSSNETGLRRGSVVLAKHPDIVESLKRMDCIRWYPVGGEVSR